MARRRLERPKRKKRQKKTSSYDWYSSVAKYLPEVSFLENDLFYYNFKDRFVSLGFYLEKDKVFYRIGSLKNKKRIFDFEDLKPVPPEKSEGLSNLLSLWLQNKVSKKGFVEKYLNWCKEES